MEKFEEKLDELDDLWKNTRSNNKIDMLRRLQGLRLVVQANALSNTALSDEFVSV